MKYLGLILLILSNRSFAQQNDHIDKMRFFIVDSLTNNGVGGGTVKINGGKVLLTDKNGVAEGVMRKVNGIDTILVSCIGFQSRILIVTEDNVRADTIKLSTIVNNLKEVKVYSKPKEILADGQEKFNSHRIPNPDEILARYIPNDTGTGGVITSLEYVLNDELHGIEKPFKVGLYTKSAGSIFPASELIADTIIVANPEKKHRVIVDISKYHIEFPKNGVIVSFETLSPSHYGKDSTWYDTKPFRASWRPKMPGIDMNLRKRNYYEIDDKHNRTVSYSMVISAKDLWDQNALNTHSYVFSEGNNFAITLTVN